MKNDLFAVLVAGTLVLSASGSTLAAGKMGGAGGMDQFQTVCPARTAGKMGGASGMDKFASSPSVESEGGKVGGGMDRCEQSILPAGSV